MATVLDSQLRASFGELNNTLSTDGTIEKCRTICTQFGLSADDVASEWDAYSTNKGVDSITVETLAAFENDLRRQKASKPRVQPKSAGSAGSKRKAAETFTKDSITAAAAATSRTVKVEPDAMSPAAAGAGAAVSQAKAEAQFASPANPTAKSVPAPHGTKPFSPASYQSPLAVPGDYANRTNAGQVVSMYNKQLPGRMGGAKPSSRPSGARCHVDTDPFAALEGEANSSSSSSSSSSDGAAGNVQKRYRYMYTSLDERAAALDAQVLSVQGTLLKRFGLAEPAAVGAPSQELIVNVGRICCAAPSGKMNKTAVQLEGTRGLSGGHRVDLDLSDVRDFALFPGQIVAVEGINSSGRKLVAKRIFSDASLPPPQTAHARLAEFHHSPSYQGGAPLSVMVAAGPFTVSDNLEFQPLVDLLTVLSTTRPDVIVLVGPFVDANHPRVKSGDMAMDYGGAVVNVSFGDLFDLKVQKTIEKALAELAKKEGVRPKVVMVPSLDDVQHDYVYPQPPFSYNFDGPGAKDVVFMSNPCCFAVNEVVFRVTSNDVLLHMGADEISQFSSGNSQGRLARLAEHCVQQRSNYPLFPCRAGSAQLDLRHWQKYGFGQRSPDVLITPSKLAHFVSKVKDTLCINPGQLAKGGNGGTFANILVQPMKQEFADDGEGKEVKHNVADRAKVSIQRV
jgi:DNA polymerase alpha subunit B